MRWDRCSWPDLKALASAGAIVVIPVGSIEQHGPHLPVATDAICAERLVDAAVERLTEDIRVVVAPAMRYGYSEDHLGFPGTLSIGSRTLEDVLIEVGAGVAASGFERLAFVNGHGGNERLLYNVVRGVRRECSRPLAVAGVTYWKLAQAELAGLRRSEMGGMGHACELETSLMLHFEPESVRMERAVRAIVHPYSPLRGNDLLAPGPVVAPDRFSERTDSGVAGDPTVASAEQGARFAQVISGRLAAFLHEFAAWPLAHPLP